MQNKTILRTAIAFTRDADFWQFAGRFAAYFIAAFAIYLAAWFFWPDNTPKPSCGCFRAYAPFSCWVRDNGGSVLRLTAKVVTIIFAFIILPTAFSLSLELTKRRTFPVVIGFATVVALIALILLDNVGLPHGPCLTIE